MKVDTSFWIVLCLLMSVSQVTNLIEQPFARSIVVCDTPLNVTLGSLPSYSLQCGDRLRVIGEGAAIAGQGQSLEHFAKFCTFPLIGIFADIFGRKPLTIVACASLTLSTFMFVVAASFPGIASSIFVVAQGLQGLTGGEALLHVMVSDIALRAGTSAGDFMVKKDQVFGIAMLLSGTLGQVIGSLELEHYGSVWMLASLFNLIGLVLGVLYFPETKAHTASAHTETRSLRQLIGTELQSYQDMFAKVPSVRWYLFLACMMALGRGFLTLAAPFAMAYFGYTQKQIIVRFVPLEILGLVFMPSVNSFCKRFGYASSFMRLGIARLSIFIVFLAFFSTHWAVAWLLKIILLPLSGFDSMWELVRLKVIGEELNAKFQSLAMMLFALSGAVASYIYSSLFDSKAGTYLGQNACPLLAMVFAILELLLFATVIGPMMRPGLQKLDSEGCEEKTPDKKTS